MLNETSYHVAFLSTRLRSTCHLGEPRPGFLRMSCYISLDVAILSGQLESPENLDLRIYQPGFIHMINFSK